MFHGGTSFGFWAGANTNNEGTNYQADPTSYDYDAPINEYGNLTQKYFDIQKIISQYAPVEKITRNDYVELMVPPPVELKPLSQNLLDLLLANPHPKKSEKPLQFETLGVRFGFVLYKTTIKSKPTIPAKLTVNDLKDRAYIYVDRVFQGILSRSEQIDSLSIVAKRGSELLILVENQGRVGFGIATGETKGISSVSLGNQKLEGNWLHYGTKNWKSDHEKISSLASVDYRSQQYVPRLFKGEFVLEQEPKDTLIDTSGWQKGVIAINGRILGKYWPVIGPQRTLYLPGVWLKKAPEKNTIIVLEQEVDSCGSGNCTIRFTDVHQIDDEVPGP